MRLLALDTSSLACTVGVLSGDRIVTRYEEQPRAHTRLLVPMIRDALRDVDLELTDLDAIVLGNGPGSFIGMRIAASVAQGLAFAGGLKIVPVSSMAAVAAGVSAHESEIVAVTQDAHMEQVYLGIYRVDNGIPISVEPERIQGHGRIENLSTGVIAAGYGWQRYPQLLQANRELIGKVSQIHYPHARALLTLGRASLERGQGVSPQELVPAYLREKVAEKPSVSEL